MLCLVIAENLHKYTLCIGNQCILSIDTCTQLEILTTPLKLSICPTTQKNEGFYVYGVCRCFVKCMIISACRLVVKNLSSIQFDVKNFHFYYEYYEYVQLQMRKCLTSAQFIVNKCIFSITICTLLKILNSSLDLEYLPHPHWLFAMISVPKQAYL